MVAGYLPFHAGANKQELCRVYSQWLPSYWSLAGVVTFAMVTGYLPFHAGANKQELCRVYSQWLPSYWSLAGVVTFAMVTGYLPFHAGANKQELCRKIVRGQFTCPDFLSESCIYLLQRMLTVDPDRRITFAEVMQVGTFSRL
jgi:serine/threonine protein kinase